MQLEEITVDFNEGSPSFIETIFDKRSTNQRVPGATLDLIFLKIMLTTANLPNSKAFQYFCTITSSCFSMRFEEVETRMRQVLKDGHSNKEFGEALKIGQLLTNNNLKNFFNLPKEISDSINSVGKEFYWEM